jgi:hypothetical protein
MAHDTNHNKKEKKVYFAPAVIMGLSFWLFAFFFLSLCNKKHHAEGEHGNTHEAHGVAAEHNKTEHESVEKSIAVSDSVEQELVDSLGNVFKVKIPAPKASE